MLTSRSSPEEPSSSPRSPASAAARDHSGSSGGRRKGAAEEKKKRKEAADGGARRRREGDGAGGAKQREEEEKGLWVSCFVVEEGDGGEMGNEGCELRSHGRFGRSYGRRDRQREGCQEGEGGGTRRRQKEGKRCRTDGRGEGGDENPTTEEVQEGGQCQISEDGEETAMEKRLWLWILSNGERRQGSEEEGRRRGRTRDQKTMVWGRNRGMEERKKNRATALAVAAMKRWTKTWAERGRWIRQEKKPWAASWGRR